MLRIRQMTPADIPAVSDLVCSTLELDYSLDTYLGIFSFWPAGALVGCMGRRIVAFLGSIIAAEGEVRILLLTISPELRRQGHGSMLLNRFIKLCLMEGMKVITLEVRKSNKIAIYFYRKHGFQMVEEMKNYYADGESGYRMALWL